MHKTLGYRKNIKIIHKDEKVYLIESKEVFPFLESKISYVLLLISNAKSDKILFQNSHLSLQMR